MRPKKILLMGLDNSGKTSIVLSLRGDNLLSYFSSDLLKPTKGVKFEDIEVLGKNYTIWDFGGQEVYRKEHLEEFRKYIPETSKIIYLIDIQDSDRYDLALIYLKQVLSLILQENEPVQFSVFLHKFDPDIEKRDKEINEKVSYLVEKISEIMPKEISYTLEKSTIYSVFQKESII